MDVHQPHCTLTGPKRCSKEVKPPKGCCLDLINMDTPPLSGFQLINLMLVKLV